MFDGYDTFCDGLDRTARWVCAVAAVVGVSLGLVLGWFCCRWIGFALSALSGDS